MVSIPILIPKTKRDELPFALEKVKDLGRHSFPENISIPDNALRKPDCRETSIRCRKFENPFQEVSRHAKLVNAASLKQSA